MAFPESPTNPWFSLGSGYQELLHFVTSHYPIFNKIIELIPIAALIGEIPDDRTTFED